MKRILFFLSVIIFLSCGKEGSFEIPDNPNDTTGNNPRDTTENNGDNDCFKTFDIIANDSTPAAGDTVVLTAKPDRWNYRWSGPKNYSYLQEDGSNTVKFSNIDVSQSGLYYCEISGLECNTLRDSIYIDVKYKQGKPDCELTDNIIYATGMHDLIATYVTKSFSSTWNDVSVSALAGFGYPDYYFLFNSHNGNSEPKDWSLYNY